MSDYRAILEQACQEHIIGAVPADAHRILREGYQSRRVYLRDDLRTAASRPSEAKIVEILRSALPHVEVGQGKCGPLCAAMIAAIEAGDGPERERHLATARGIMLWRNWQFGRTALLVRDRPELYFASIPAAMSALGAAPTDVALCYPEGGTRVPRADIGQPKTVLGISLSALVGGEQRTVVVPLGHLATPERPVLVEQAIVLAEAGGLRFNDTPSSAWPIR